MTTEEEARAKLVARYELVRHMTLASLTWDGRGGVSAHVHTCIDLCRGKHPEGRR